VTGYHGCPVPVFRYAFRLPKKCFHPWATDTGAASFQPLWSSDTITSPPASLIRQCNASRLGRERRHEPEPAIDPGPQAFFRAEPGGGDIDHPPHGFAGEVHGASVRLRKSLLVAFRSDAYHQVPVDDPAAHNSRAALRVAARARPRPGEESGGWIRGTVAEGDEKPPGDPLRSARLEERTVLRPPAPEALRS
jgi:hypothetical protein